ncbi:MAG TPA: MFS transporter [Rhizomicrobium sp.]|nr:MFS transporter [Rhizomicrobium sp.]
MTSDNSPARFRWLPPGLRPPVPMSWRQEHVFLLVGVAALFAGYDMNVFTLATPQIQASFHIAENHLTTIVAYFRLAALFSLLLAASADLVGRRRLLLFTILGQAVATLATAFTTSETQFMWAQFFTRMFGYTEEILCFVVIAEEVAAKARGWATGTLSALEYWGAGVASLIFAAITFLPYGWRSMYVIGALPLFLMAYLRRQLPETQRFVAQAQLLKARSKFQDALLLVRDLAREYPGRIAAILIAVAAFGFGIVSASVLSAKYLQSVEGYSPGQVTMLFIPGGLVSLALTILVGKFSDRVGRRAVLAGIVAMGGMGFYLFYSGVSGWLLAPLWSISFFGYFSGEALLTGLTAEIVPTRYRATVSGLRYLVEILAGSVALILEGRLYDRFHGHGPAIQALLVVLPITLVALAFLPEPAGKTLEEMAA